MTKLNRDRALGGLIGLAAGDALGTTLEFSGGVFGAEKFEGLLRGPHKDITGGGPFGMEPGQTTDDTQLATCIARSLVATGGEFDPEELGQRFIVWRRSAFDCGGTCGGAISRIKTDGALNSGRLHWLPSKSGAANGSLMRTAPIGVFFAGDDDRRRRVSMVESAITHFDPRCQLACAAYNGAIARAITMELDPGEIPTAEMMIGAAHSELKMSSYELTTRYPEFTAEIERAAMELASDLQAAEQDHPFKDVAFSVAGGGANGFVRVGFRLAFWELAHSTTYEEGLVDCVNRGGDSDTNGAIAGGLLGARYGLSGIPRGWTTKVLEACEGKEGSPWQVEFHPKAFMELYGLMFGEQAVDEVMTDGIDYHKHTAAPAMAGMTDDQILAKYARDHE